MIIVFMIIMTIMIASIMRMFFVGRYDGDDDQDGVDHGDDFRQAI